MREDRAVLGESESQSPFLILLGPLVIEGISSTVMLDITMMLLAVVAVATTPGDEDPEQVCQEKWVECAMTGLADRRGDKRKHSRCEWCRKDCVKHGGHWPLRAQATVGTVSCEYWRWRRAP